MQVPVELSKYEPAPQPPSTHLTLLPSYVHVMQLPGQPETHTDSYDTSVA